MWSNAATLELLARGAAIGAFAGLAIIMARGAPTPARVTGALFCIAAASHTLTQIRDIDAALGVAWGPVWAFSVMGAGLFWAFAVELFDDGARIALHRFAPSALLIIFALGGVLARPPIAPIFWLLHNVASAVLIAHALFVISAGWRGDLVETRRRSRGPILAASAIYALAVISVETWELYFGSAHALSPVAAVALLSFALLALGTFGRMEPDLFGQRPRRAEAPLLVPALDGEEARQAASLERLMREERAYRAEGLTIASLALKLRLPEHRLRRLINQRLGHRSFSAFLNQWRLGDAKQALSDPAQAGVPISTIAFDAGFGSLGPFNRAFKAETGLTPSEFRAQALGGGQAAAQVQKPAT